jgi:hypothetical protein
MESSERVFLLAGSIMAASPKTVSVEQCVALARTIVAVCDEIGRERTLEI